MAKEITEFDKLIYDDSVCMLKESLPYIDIANQKSFALIIMVMEMENVIKLYEHDYGKIKNFCKSGSINDIISTLEKHCNDTNHKNMSTIKSLLKTLRTFEKYKDILTPDVMNTIFSIINTDTSNYSNVNTCSFDDTTNTCDSDINDNTNASSNSSTTNSKKNQTNNSAMYDMLFNMMNPKQKELFNSYKSILFWGGIYEH